MGCRRTIPGSISKAYGSDVTVNSMGGVIAVVMTLHTALPLTPVAATTS